MNKIISKKIKKLLTSIVISNLIIGTFSCSLYEKPMDSKEVNISINMENNIPTDDSYTITSISNTCTKTTITSTICVSTFGSSIVTDFISNIGQTETEDYNNSVSTSVTTSISSSITTGTITETTTTTAVTTYLMSSYHVDFVKTFERGTYYPYPQGTKGGSGRTLIDCSIGENDIKGSIASSYLYNLYGYNHNGRTKVYLEVPQYPNMEGYYYLDDCDAWNPNVIDFYYYTANNCPFQYVGVVTVNCYVVDY